MIFMASFPCAIEGIGSGGNQEKYGATADFKGRAAERCGRGGKTRIFWKNEKSLFIIGLLLVAVAIFEFSPAVKEARAYVSHANYENAQISCQTLLTDRPWYGKMNYWFFTWLVFVPALIFSVTPRHPAWMQCGRISHQ